MFRQPSGAFYKGVIFVWLTLSLGSVLLAAMTWVKLSSRVAAARQLTAARVELDAIQESLTDIESGARGYVVAGDRKILEPFYAAQTNLPAQFNRLVDIVRDDAGLLKTVTSLQAQTELLRNSYRDAVDTRDHSLSRATDIIASGDGRKVMDTIRIQIAQLDRMVADDLAGVRAQIDSQLLRANLTSLGAGLVGIGAGMFAFWLTRVTVQHQRRERELTEAKLQAERSNREKTVFLANMSHEIRTPMNAILGFSELLQGDLREPKHRQYLQSIHSSAKSLLLLINDILDMSKIEAGVMDLRPEPTDPREICDFVRTLFAEPAHKKSLKLECHMAGDLPHALLIDRIRLRQVMVNLVGNAVKFTDQGGIDVRILWEREDTSSRVTLVIEVQDTGVGIPQDKLDVIFRPFVQAGAHRDKEKQGTGLGLSIVKRLTEAMGGTVTVASVLGQGSAFHLRFPNVPISARIPSSDKLHSKLEVDFNDLRPATLLVVDDNETNCQLIAGMFAGTHHRLVFGSSGEEAVSKAAEIKPDLILLDVRMPGMGGREALTEIRKIPGLDLLPVIAVTASTLVNEDNALKERFSGYVRKPFSKRDLFDELSAFLPRHARPEPDVVAVPPESGNGSLPAVAAPGPAELVARLRLLLNGPWPALRDSVAINESKAFARKLENLGQQCQCPPLVLYAQTLIRDAENYAVVDLEKHLNEFSVLVEQLDQKPSA